MNESGGARIGIDLGGTNVRAGALGPDGRWLSFVSRRFGLPPEPGIRLLIELVEGVIEELRGTPPLSGIGIGATGPLDLATGRIRNPYTLPGWDDVDVVGPLARRFRVPVVLENDADAAGLGEHWLGAGRGSRRMALITVGTGIGTALVLDGDLYRGADGYHPEAGHHSIDPAGPLCYCGARGCWEQLASGTAIERLGAAELGGSPTAAEVVSAARRGDVRAKAIVERAAADLARGVFNLVAFYAPDTVVLAGGMLAAGEQFLPAVTAMLEVGLPPPSGVRVVPALLGDRAGVAGAAYAAGRQT